MYTNSIFAFSGALFSVVAAVPMAGGHHHHHHPRDVVLVEHLEVVYETVDVTLTVWVDPTGSPPEIKPTGYESTSSNPETTAAATTPAAYIPPAPPVYNAPPPPSYAPVSTSSSSVYVPPPAPTTPTSTYVAPAPTYAEPTPYVAPTSEPAPSSAPAPPATPEVPSSSSGVSGMAAAGKTYTGDLTWYDVGMGACGKTNVASDPVIAIPEAIFDAYNPGNPNNNPLCGKTITITGKDGTKFTGTVVDRCPGCKVNDLDLSQDFFNKVTNNGDGRVGGMEWCFD